jgi:hypothetical protein
MVVPRAERAFLVPPDPGRAGSLDELIEALQSLKVWAGGPSYETIKDRVNTAWQAEGRPRTELTGKTTVVDCFRTGRRRVNADLVIAVVAALHPVDRVLFVNLRGVHPDPAQPPAEPAAVLDGFLRLLGVSSQQIPHDLAARTAAYRARLAGTRTLVVLDNAADAGHARPLLPETPGCPVLVTSRRDLTGLHPAVHLTMNVFTPGEAATFLARATAGIPAGDDPHAAARIAHRCGNLPLALGLITGHIRGMPGWTLTDHADRLDERHRDRRLDTGVELAFDLSYRYLPAG